MRFSYKYTLLLLILIYILFEVINFFNYKYDYVHNDYIENETITILTNKDNINQILHELSQFESIVSRVYIDPSNEVFRINALKNSSLINLERTFQLILEPDLSYFLNNLFKMIYNSVKNKSLDKELIYNKINLLNDIINEINVYFSKEEVDN